VAGDDGYHWMKRSDLAMQLFPDMKRKDAGIAVSRIIHEYPLLKRRMYACGYVPGKVGYSAEMVRILCEFFESPL